MANAATPIASAAKMLRSGVSIFPACERRSQAHVCIQSSSLITSLRSPDRIDEFDSTIGGLGCQSIASRLSMRKLYAAASQRGNGYGRLPVTSELGTLR